ncbi:MULTISPECIES: prephenate dehydratase [Actinokineospora]|uniref:Prephenate dehydratase n=1 Tax=Actinokineospora fastidiosa TaxID=1816 RepID=A0A918G4V3_9PSEU|nr:MULTISPECIES: prephenate dehydratase [Actinokineospora]UVS76438.1 Prephenate dehydratase [Actinokineospora sp. UTMC 2448]GGS18164.1 prephenate dehydratase [Actinokineospora fastidiosa]
MPRIAYFGPQGTFTEQAARAFDGQADLVPLPTIPKAVAAVRTGAADLACVPVENSVEGAVSATMDALAVDEPVVAVAEHVLPIRFSVLVRPGTTEIRTVASHPHALAQVQGWLSANLPEATQLAATSTAGAAVGVVEGQYDAAVTAPVAATHYPLEERATDVADERDAVTRFLLLSRPTTAPAPTGADRTSVLAVVAHQPGELQNLLTELALRGINLSRIESRPLRGRFGEYRFYLDFDGHIAEHRVGEALAALHRRSQQVRFLGSYPKADGAASLAPPGHRDIDHAASAAWLAALRTGGEA